MPDPRPEKQYPLVILYIFSEKPDEFITFLKNVFNAIESRPTTHSEEGDVQNAMLNIGSFYMEISRARDTFKQVSLSFHYYTDNLEQLHQKSLDYGCKEKYKPTKMDYGDIESWVIDPFGNNWFLATYVN